MRDNFRSPMIAAAYILFIISYAVIFPGLRDQDPFVSILLIIAAIGFFIFFGYQLFFPGKPLNAIEYVAFSSLLASSSFILISAIFANPFNEAKPVEFPDVRFYWLIGFSAASIVLPLLYNYRSQISYWAGRVNKYISIFEVEIPNLTVSSENVTVSRHVGHIFQDIRPLTETEKGVQELLRVHGILTRSKTMIGVLTGLKNIAMSRMPVLITGESGVGKELVAKAIHALSDRQQKGKMITFNSSNIRKEYAVSALFGHKKGAYTGAVEDKKGYFDTANKGTLFIDEIGELDWVVQADLLRVLDDGEFHRYNDIETIKVDVRIITATNHDLKNAVSEKTFKEDLYHRLNGVSFNIPPLSKRPEDIPLLAKHFFTSIPDISYDPPLSIFEPLIQVEWKGNVRVLKNKINECMLDFDQKSPKDSLVAIINEIAREPESEISDDSHFEINPKYARAVLTYQQNNFDASKTAIELDEHRDSIAAHVNTAYLQIGKSYEFDINNVIRYFMDNNLLASDQGDRFKREFIKRYTQACEAGAKLRKNAPPRFRYHKEVENIIRNLDTNLFN